MSPIRRRIPGYNRWYHVSIFVLPFFEQECLRVRSEGEFPDTTDGTMSPSLFFHALNRNVGPSPFSCQACQKLSKAVVSQFCNFEGSFKSTSARTYFLAT